MELTKEFREDWVDLMAKHMNSTIKIHLDRPEALQRTIFMKMSATMDINVTVLEKYTRSIKVEFYVFNNRFEEIIYLPTSLPVASVLDKFEEKITKIVNDWLKENDKQFIVDKYKQKNKRIENIIDEFEKKKRFEEREKKNESDNK